MASGPQRFKKFGRLVPHWVTAARCARAPGSRSRSLRRSSPSRRGDRRQGEGARTMLAGFPRARARAPSRDPLGLMLSGSRELLNSLKVPSTFSLWA